MSKEREVDVSVDDGEPCEAPPPSGEIEESGSALTLTGAENG